MKQRKWWSAVIWASFIHAIGCGSGDAANPLDPSTFAGMHADKVSFDCQHTIQCTAQRGEELVDDPVNTCIHDTAELLQARPDMHMLYLSNVTRCQNLVVCDYVDCARADLQGGWGQSQIDKVTHNCQQDVECRRQLGMLAGDPTAELDSCIGSNVGYLDTFTPEQRAQYEADYVACTGYFACDFANCFPW